MSDLEKKRGAKRPLGFIIGCSYIFFLGCFGLNPT